MKTHFIDLHLHLDGSLYLPWQYEKALEFKTIESDTTFEEYYDKMYQTEFKTREEGFKRFDIPIAVLQTKESLADSVYLLLKQCYELGLVYVEIRFAPQQHTSILSQDEVVASTIEGLNRGMNEFDIKGNLILCCMHKGDHASFNMKENLETVEVASKYLNKGVCAIDLAGYENTGPFMAYEPIFIKAKELGIPYTIHAGEMGEGVHVPEAIKMGAHRIGHGINCIQNEEWLQEVVDTQIPLEVCVTSNCGLERNYAKHPIRTLLERNVKVTLNTDNMTFSRTNLNYEHYECKMLGISEETLMQCTYNAIDAAFCNQETKEWIRKKIEEMNENK